MQPSKDTSQLDTGLITRLVLLVTAIFVLFLIVVYTIAYLPTQPNIPNPYNMAEWPTAEAQMQQQLSGYSAYEVNADTGEMADPEDEEEVTEMRYTIPITMAREVVVQQGMIQSRVITQTTE